MGTPEHVVVVGGGIGGLATALALDQVGHPVTLVDRDPLPVATDADEAFAQQRAGAPQAHHTHGFLARMRVVLRDRFPGVLDELLAAGCTTMGGAANLGDPRPGDDDLAALVVRRTTFEWILRRAVQARPEIEVRTGVGARGLVAEGAAGPTGDGAPPRVTGVRLDDGTTLGAGTVVAANGRRSAVPDWLAEVGATVAETRYESGLMYLSRWYRTLPGTEVGFDPKLMGDLGFVKFLAVPGDGGSLSVTLAIRADDAQLRAALSGPEHFDRACALIPGPDRFFDSAGGGAVVEPVGPVRLMGGLINRLRRFTGDDGRPVVTGFHAVGDAHTCTNPLYGRGCSLALVQAVLLADAVVAHPADPLARATAYEQACAREVEPWFHVSVQMDSLGSDPSGAGLLGGGDAQGGRAMAAVFVAAATDPILARGLARFWHLLTTPSELMADAEFLGRMAEVMADPDAYPVPQRSGPTRDEVLGACSPVA